ncbi:dopamine receptor 2-like [Patiria miniata]|uniref:G-protein coupled receptors family 1 profile domain-containing protein n=1 Tax=Patiria miniata TaxID=46514 RepID=A0A914B379_PATMI|nr:dopamine receptor 2-like [Patiria miniata]
MAVDVASIASKVGYGTLPSLTLDVNKTDLQVNGTDSPTSPSLGTADVVVLGIVLCTCMLLIVFGNILVILAVYRDRSLRRSVTNYFIVSLAFADLLIGGLVVPISIIDTLNNGYWFLGRAICDLWHALDILGCTASILNLCVISLDRFWAVTHPLSYPRRMTRKVALIFIVLVWCCSAFISFPCIAWWHAMEGPMPDNVCIFPSDAFYLVLSSCVSFYVPSIIMLFMYFRIYRAAAAQMRHIRSGTKLVSTGKNNPESNGTVSLRIHRGGGASYNGSGNKRYSVATDSRTHANQIMGRRLLSRMNREHKAAKTLGIVVGVFVVCWLPFFVVNVASPLCPTCISSPHIVIPLLTWLGYINSALNPAIYAFTNKSFKRAYKKILCRCGRRQKGHFLTRDGTTFMSIDSTYSMADMGPGTPSP